MGVVVFSVNSRKVGRFNLPADTPLPPAVGRPKLLALCQFRVRLALKMADIRRFLYWFFAARLFLKGFFEAFLEEAFKVGVAVRVDLVQAVVSGIFLAKDDMNAGEVKVGEVLVA